MPASYTVSILSDAGSGDNVYIELVAAANVIVAVYKIEVSVVVAGADTGTSRVRVFRETTAATGLTAGVTVIELNPAGAAPTTTANVKASGVFGGSGTTTDTLLDVAYQDRQTFSWVATTERDFLRSDAGGRLIFRHVSLNSSGNHLYSVFFREES